MMIVSDIDSLLKYVKEAPTCDGNHVWVHDDNDEEDEYHCEGCFVIKETEDEQ